MTLRVECPNCGTPYKVKDELAGKKMRCRECSSTIQVPYGEDDLDFDADVSDDEGDELPQRRSSPKKSSGPQKTKGKSKKNSAPGMSGTTKLLLGLAGGGLFCMLLCCGGAVLIGRHFAHRITGGVAAPSGQTFDQWHSTFETKLTRQGEAPQDYDDESPPPNVEEVVYPSEGLNLKAWVYRPPGVTEPRPALVFFHGGFAFGSGDLTEACAPFIDAGYVVMAPMLRGENGNPGIYELFLGEIDDARAATQWLAKQPYVDNQHIYAFGHSIGGGVSALLTLLNDVPIRHSGSSGGLYDHQTFLLWQLDETVPFENTPEERSVRLLVGNVKYLQHPHFAFIGTEDAGFHATADQLQRDPAAAGKLTVERIPGDHFSSFDPSIRKYLQIAEQDRAGGR